MKRFVEEYANYEREKVFKVFGAVKVFQVERVRKIGKIVKACRDGIITDDEAVRKLSELCEEPIPQKWNPDTFYTGGGITLCAMFFDDDGSYYVLDTMDEEPGLSVYTDGSKRDEWSGDYPLMDYERSITVDEMTDMERAAYKQMTEDYEAYCEKYGL